MRRRDSLVTDVAAGGAFSPQFERHTVRPSSDPAPEREQKMAALGYLNEAWADARLDGIEDDCIAMACLFAAFAELVSTYGEEAAAQFADGLSKRIRNGEFSIDLSHQ